MTIYQTLEDIADYISDVIGDVPRFGYRDAALSNDNGIPGHNTFSDNNSNNVPLADGTKLTPQEAEKGFRDRLSTLSREMFTHFFGRVSYNFNKLKQLMADVLDIYKREYAHNFREYDSNIVYEDGDVCYIVAGLVRYCFISVIDNNSSPIVYNGNGTFDFDSDCWQMLQEKRTVIHPVGEPFLWFDSNNIPAGCINFSNGQTYVWNDPVYDFSSLKGDISFISLMEWWGSFGASYNENTGFTVPLINERYHISKPTGNTVAPVPAVIPEHAHPVATAPATQTVSASGHTHPLTFSASSHEHYAGWLNEGYDTFTGAYLGYVSSSSIVDFQSGKKYMDQDDDRSWWQKAVQTTSKTNSVTMGAHAGVAVPDTTLSHTHTASGTTGAWEMPAGKYRPGTVSACLLLRYK